MAFMMRGKTIITKMTCSSSLPSVQRRAQSPTFDIQGIAQGLQPAQMLTVRATREDGSTLEFQARVRIDTPVEVQYYEHGGILPHPRLELGF